MPVTLSEAASKDLLAPYGIPFAIEVVVADEQQAVDAAESIGYPVAAKLNGEGIAHKTERGLVRLGLGDADSLRAAVADLWGRATPEDGEVSVLVASMVSGERELLCGLSIDPSFGPTVMVGIGGVTAEVLGDVAVRLAPMTRADAHDMIDQLSNRALLDEFRGEPPVDREALVDVLMALDALATARDDIVSVDLNPLIISAGRPVAVDALVELLR